MDPTLLCWVRGDDVDDVFELEIPGEADVGELKQALKDRRSATFSDVDACNLHLYPLLVPSNADLAVQLGRWRLHDKKPLYVTQKLSDIFPKFRDGKWVVVVIHPTAGMEFSVYFRNQILPVSAVGDDTIKHFLSGLLRDQQYEHVFRNVSTQMLRVYRLNPPVLETKEGKYLDNLEPMKGTDTVEVSFGESTVTRRHVCLAFMRVEDESNKVIETLERVHTRIFSSLKITVRTALKWTMDDVQDNLAGGKYTEDGRANVAEIEKIQDLLSSVRIYDQTMQKHHDFKIAQEYGEDGGLFDKTFKALSEDQTDGTTVGNAREFFTFYRILHCWHEDASKIRDQRLSAVKAGSFAAYFIQPPFFSDFSPDIEYKTEIPWGFPIFVRTNDVLDIWRKYKPKSDLMASSANHLIPFFVSNAISMTNEGDRFRMLLQAIAAARAGNILLKKTSKRNFFVVAVYLDKNMVASRYIIIQTGEGSDEPAEEFRQGNAVSIHCNDFDLTDKIKAIEFLREMYNLAGELNSLVKDLDLDMTRTLKQVADAARSVLSLHSRNHPTVRMDFIPGQDEFDEGCGSEDGDEDKLDEGYGYEDDDDELGVFGSDDVQEHLLSMRYAIDFRVFGHENLAVVRSKTDGSPGYLKFVEPARQQEVETLQFLSGIQSPANHTISGVEIWPVQGGTMISMPVAGGRLTSLERPNEHLWSAASQLVEGVAFMHAQLVAHMDLKPQNIIIPPQGGRLCIIDFSSSIRLKSEKEKFRGIAGTPGYIAPEVERGDAYKPIQADLWSCGRTLKDLCSICKPSPDRDFLFGVAAGLMRENPDYRLTMSKVQERLTSWKEALGAGTHNLE